MTNKPIFIIAIAIDSPSIYVHNHKRNQSFISFHYGDIRAQT